MFKVGKISLEKPLLLAPMEDVSDYSFRIVCKEMGADVVYTEFVNSEGLKRGNEKTKKKLKIFDDERPVAIQIYGENIESMVTAAQIAEEQNPDFIDINAGCWVKKIANRGAGAGLLKDPPYLQKMVSEIVNAVSVPVTVKTRIGWDKDDIKIVEVAKMLEDTGIEQLTIHCRTRSQGHSGDPDWSWIPKVKEVVNIPIALNGGIWTAGDVLKAYNETNADAIMIARGAIGQPWLFLEAKELMEHGKILTEIDETLRIKSCLKHLKLAIDVKGERRAILEHRKYYSGYLKGLRNASHVRREMMNHLEYEPIEEFLLKYLDQLITYKNEFTEYNENHEEFMPEEDFGKCNSNCE